MRGRFPACARWDGERVGQCLKPRKNEYARVYMLLPEM
jgi:hypothetical protein